MVGRQRKGKETDIREIVQQSKARDLLSLGASEKGRGEDQGEESRSEGRGHVRQQRRKG